MFFIFGKPVRILTKGSFLFFLGSALFSCEQGAQGISGPSPDVGVVDRALPDSDIVSLNGSFTATNRICAPAGCFVDAFGFNEYRAWWNVVLPDSVSADRVSFSLERIDTVSIMRNWYKTKNFTISGNTLVYLVEVATSCGGTPLQDIGCMGKKAAGGPDQMEWNYHIFYVK